MPLSRGKSDRSRGENIAKLIREGYPLKQAVAIAMKEQRRAKGKRGAGQKIAR